MRVTTISLLALLALGACKDESKDDTGPTGGEGGGTGGGDGGGTGGGDGGGDGGGGDDTGGGASFDGSYVGQGTFAVTLVQNDTVSDTCEGDVFLDVADGVVGGLGTCDFKGDLADSVGTASFTFAGTIDDVGVIAGTLTDYNDEAWAGSVVGTTMTGAFAFTSEKEGKVEDFDGGFTAEWQAPKGQ